ncbi:hypothetical protein G7009_21925 [Pseudomonas capeferrum]|uniref:hypothetical protein n=1 Tax=Pseudomonas capeferrum TaxID=1495066 RepID=UPI0015E39321|nr:hypothetical protein [Pseudomonas capeferrum]MBA1204381.1 hypothetical protein [Pseudomonas capeferrum]
MNHPQTLRGQLHNGVQAKDDSPYNIALAVKIARIRDVEHLACDCNGSSAVIFRECAIWLVAAAILWIGGLFVVFA